MSGEGLGSQFCRFFEDFSNDLTPADSFAKFDFWATNDDDVRWDTEMSDA